MRGTAAAVLAGKDGMGLARFHDAGAKQNSHAETFKNEKAGETLSDSGSKASKCCSVGF
jgi:hypothetical protein